MTIFTLSVVCKMYKAVMATVTTNLHHYKKLFTELNGPVFIFVANTFSIYLVVYVFVSYYSMFFSFTAHKCTFSTNVSS